MSPLLPKSSFSFRLSIFVVMISWSNHVAFPVFFYLLFVLYHLFPHPPITDCLWKVIRSLVLFTYWWSEHRWYSWPFLPVYFTAIEDSNMIQFYEETLVSFGDLTDDVIHGYIETGEPM